MKPWSTVRLTCLALMLFCGLAAGGCVFNDAQRTRLEAKINQVDEALAKATPYLVELEKIVNAGRRYVEALPAEDPQRAEVAAYVKTGEDFVAAVKQGTQRLETLSVDLKASLAALPPDSGSPAADALATVGSIGTSVGPLLPQPIGLAVAAVSSLLTGIAGILAVRAKQKAAQEAQITESIVTSIESAKAAGAISFSDALAQVLRATQSPQARARVDEIQWSRS